MGFVACRERVPSRHQCGDCVSVAYRKIRCHRHDGDVWSCPDEPISVLDEHGAKAISFGTPSRRHPPRARVSEQLEIALTAVAECAIPRLALSPHADERRVGGIVDVDHAVIALARGGAVEPPDVLLERAAPGERHCEDEGVERRVVEPRQAQQGQGRSRNLRRRGARSVNEWLHV